MSSSLVQPPAIKTVSLFLSHTGCLNKSVPFFIEIPIYSLVLVPLKMHKTYLKFINYVCFPPRGKQHQHCLHRWSQHHERQRIYSISNFLLIISQPCVCVNFKLLTKNLKLDKFSVARGAMTTCVDNVGVMHERMYRAQILDQDRMRNGAFSYMNLHKRILI